MQRKSRPHYGAGLHDESTLDKTNLVVGRYHIRIITILENNHDGRYADHPSKPVQESFSLRLQRMEVSHCLDRSVPWFGTYFVKGVEERPSSAFRLRQLDKIPFGLLARQAVYHAAIDRPDFAIEVADDHRLHPINDEIFNLFSALARPAKLNFQMDDARTGNRNECITDKLDLLFPETILEHELATELLFNECCAEPADKGAIFGNMIREITAPGKIKLN